MPLDDPGQIDISLALLGSEGNEAINRLVDTMSALDERLGNIAQGQGGQAATAASAQRIRDISRGVIPTGSVSAPPGAITLPGGSIYRPEGVGPVSPVSDSNLNERARRRLGDQRFMGVPEGETQTQGRIVAGMDRLLGKLPGFAPSQARGIHMGNMGMGFEGGFGGGGFGGYGGYGGFGGGIAGGLGGPPGGIPGQPSTPGAEPPNWAQTVNWQAAQQEFYMPFEWGALSSQAKLELAANAAARMSQRRIRQEQQTRAQTTADTTYQDVISRGESPENAENAAQQMASMQAPDYTQGERSGIAAGYLQRAAQYVPYAQAISGGVSGAANRLGGFAWGTQDISSIDPHLVSMPWLINPLHWAQGSRAYQQLGQQLGYQAGTQDISLPGPLGTHQLPWETFGDAASRAAENLALTSMNIHRQYSRVTAEDAAKFQMGIANYGYSGAQGNAIAYTGAGIMQRTGIDPEILSGIMGQSLHEGTASLQEFGDTLNQLPNLARRAGMPLDELAKSLEEFGQSAAENRGAISTIQGMNQGAQVTGAFPGMTPDQANQLVNDPMMQSLLMANTGRMPFQQGTLSGSAIAGSAQQMAHLYMNAGAAFAQPTTTRDAFGATTTTDARTAQIQAAAGMAHMPVSEFKRLLGYDQNDNRRTAVASEIQAYLDPGAYGHVSASASQIVRNATGARLRDEHGKPMLSSKESQYLQYLSGTDPRRALTRLQNDINAPGIDKPGQGLPGPNVQISITDEFKQLLGFGPGGKKKTTSVDLSRAFSQAGGTPSAQTLLDPAANAANRSIAAITNQIARGQGQ